jgi:hypothetical protein
MKAMFGHAPAPVSAQIPSTGSQASTLAQSTAPAQDPGKRRRSRWGDATATSLVSDAAAAAVAASQAPPLLEAGAQFDPVAEALAAAPVTAEPSLPVAGGGAKRTRRSRWN